MDYRKTRAQNEKMAKRAVISIASAVGLAGALTFSIISTLPSQATAVQAIDQIYMGTLPSETSDALSGFVSLTDADDDTEAESTTVNLRYDLSSMKINDAVSKKLSAPDNGEDGMNNAVLSYMTLDFGSQATADEGSSAENVEDTAADTDTTADTVEDTAVDTNTEPAVVEDNTAPVYSWNNLYLDTADVRKPSNMTLEQLQKWAKRFAPNWVGLESQILEYDKRINLVFLLAVARAETGAGNPDSLVGTYNCFNIKGKNGYVNYNSYMESIEDFVSLLERAYLDPDGIYFNGYSICGIGVKYAGAHWGPGIMTLADELIWHFDAGSLSK